MASSTFDIPIICGPTASGKTAIGIELAERISGEIISMDSRQIFRRLDIGAAKATPEEQARVKHHLIDVADPGERFTVSDFARLAGEAVADIISRGKRPIFVGGTPFYLSALIGNFDFCEVDIDQEFRDKLNEEASQIGTDALHERLREADPESADKIHPNDIFRIVRALEILHLSGKPASAMRTQSVYRPATGGNAAGTELPGGAAYKVFCLYMPREKLYDRINKRALNMYNIGLTDETRETIKDFPESRAFLTKTIGYGEALDLIEGKMTLEEAVEETAKRTRRFAKRQMTWLRSVEGSEWIDALAPAGITTGYLESKGIN